MCRLETKELEHLQFPCMGTLQKIKTLLKMAKQKRKEDAVAASETLFCTLNNSFNHQIIYFS